MAENHITTRQMDFIEFMIANPLKTAKELCKEYGLSNNTYSTWRKQPKFKEYLSKRLQEKWKDNELMAQATIEQLARMVILRLQNTYSIVLGMRQFRKSKRKLRRTP